MSYVRLPPSILQPVLSDKTQLRTQFAALCFRQRNGKTQVLLVTGRKSGKWILPKGWPMPGRAPAQVAAQEAWEEAGVKGDPIDRCLGLYSYRKNTRQGVTLPCIALIYPVKVRRLKKSWPETGQRRRKWFPLKKAARKVSSPQLAQALRDFDPARLA
jgi:8-oxo-dGTP pyrophosphatase MutT (NUDIX family)